MNVVKYIKLTMKNFMDLKNDYESLLLNQKKNTSILRKIKRNQSRPTIKSIRLFNIKKYFIYFVIIRCSWRRFGYITPIFLQIQF